MLSEDAGAIGSALSGEESGACRDSGEGGSASENAGGSGACSSVASEPARADALEAILAAIANIDAGEVEVARAGLLALAAALRASSHAGAKDEEER
jgi:hypothetical protein